MKVSIIDCVRSPRRRGRLATLLFVLMVLARCGMAQITFTATNLADAFLATGSVSNSEGTNLTGLNFGGAGTLALAPASSPNGEYQSVLRFSVSNAITLFDSALGANSWRITNVSLSFASNFGTEGAQPSLGMFDAVHGGQFVVEWLADDSWDEGSGNPNAPSASGVTYGSLTNLLSLPHEILETNTYTPPGNNVREAYSLRLGTNLIADITSGGEISFRLYAADQQLSYLINSHEFGHGNEPRIQITTVPARLEILSGYFTNGNFRLVGVGRANLAYQVQATTNLTGSNWVTLGTVVSDGAALIQYDDLTASNHARRFYRLSQF